MTPGIAETEKDVNSAIGLTEEVVGRDIGETCKCAA
jgi:hypothetical protein